MKKNSAPLIIAGVLFAFFFFKRKASAAPFISASQADNAKRAAPARLASNRDNSLLTAGIGAGAGLLRTIIQALSGRGGGGSSGGGSGGGGVRPDGGGGAAGAKPSKTPEQVKVPDRGNSAPTYPGLPYGTKTPEDQAWNPEPAGTGSQSAFETDSTVGQNGFGAFGQALLFGRVDYPSGTDTGNLSNTWFDPALVVDYPSGTYVESTQQFDSGLQSAGLASAGGNPIANLGDFTDNFLFAPSSDTAIPEYAVPDYASGTYVDPFQAYDWSSDFQDYSSWDYSNYYDSGSGGGGGDGSGDEKRATVGPSGGGGNTYVRNSSGGFTLNPPNIPGWHP